MIRGLDRQLIFRTEADRVDFINRVTDVHKATGLTILAWALLPNHAHLLVRTGQRPLSTAMRSLLTGYAGAFNRRHHRVGHLFQNRYKSILVEEEPYLLELVRYIHLNPLRVGLVKDLAGLKRYPWSGHSALVGKVPRPWQERAEILGQFATGQGLAKRRYLEFMAAGATQGRRPELQGGGLVRSLGGWKRVAVLRRGREAWAADERILGESYFVIQMQKEAAAAVPVPRTNALAVFPKMLARCARAFGVAHAEIVSGSRRRVVAHARMVAGALAVQELGLPIREVARRLGVSPTVTRENLWQAQKLLAERGLTPENLIRGLRQ
jgi:REP element-mobilizing transposase RayT